MERQDDTVGYKIQRLMIEYLMNIKGMSYDQILSDSIKEDVVYKELNDWYSLQIKNSHLD